MTPMWSPSLVAVAIRVKREDYFTIKGTVNGILYCSASYAEWELK